MFNRRIFTTPPAPPLTFAFRVKATSTADTITIPASAEVGDLAVLLDWMVDFTPNFTTPAGWTFIGEDERSGGGGGGARMSMKLLVGGDPGSLITASSGGSVQKKLMLVFSGNHSTIADFSYVGDFGGGGTTSPQTITSGGGTPDFVIIGHSAYNGTGEDFTGSTAFDAEEEGPDSGQLGGYKIVTSSPVNHTVDRSGNGNTGLIQGVYIQVT